MRNLILTITLTLGPALLCHSQEKPEVYMVSNAHLDTQWKWTVQSTIDEYLENTLRQNLVLLETYPDYVFNFEGAIKYAWAKEYYPDLYERVKKYVAEGRWNPSGGFWDANDTNVPCSESTFRNFLYGQEFFMKEFGVKSKDILMPDCFGFSYTLPAIANHCGIIGFSTQKLAWRTNPFYEDGRKFPFRFGIWEGIDGSRIMAAMNGGNYDWDPKEDIRNLPEFKKLLEEAPVPAIYRYYGTQSPKHQCDRGGSPSPLAVSLLKEAKDNPQDYKVLFARSEEMFIDYYMDERLPVYKGELLMDVHGVGCYSSVSRLKRLNRQNELRLLAAEQAAVMTDWLGGINYPHYTLDEGWKRILWHQFHDDLTGTSIPKAYEFTHNDEYLNLNQMDNIIESSILSSASVLDTDVKGLPLVVYNPATVTNRDYVTAVVPLAENTEKISVVSPSGKREKVQIISREADKATVIFTSSTPSAGISVYDIRPGESGSSSSSLKTGSRSIENRIYKVILDENGDIASIRDKRYGKELVKKGEAFALEMFEKNESFQWPAWEVLKTTIDREPNAVNEGVVISTEERGPVRATIKVERKHGKSLFIQRISLTDGACDDRIDIRCEVDWQSDGCLLKASFPTAFESSETTYDLGLGHIRRGINTETAYEVPGQKWADISADDGAYGITILNDCKYGWDKPDSNTLRLTLFHSPLTNGSRYPEQQFQDNGKHIFTYSICGHNGVLDPSQAQLQADCLNHRKVYAAADRHEGKGRTLTFAESSDPSIRINALKKAQDGDGIIVRIYEISGNGGSSRIIFPSEIISAEEVNGLEEFKGNAVISGRELTVNASAFEPKTFRVRLAGPAHKAEGHEYTPLELPFNAVAFSTDAFAPFGKMDRKWRSYAGELIPENLEFRGVPFVFGKPDFNDAVRCAGQKVSVPEGCSKVYMLVAASEKDRTASFLAGDKAVNIPVGYFTDIWDGNGDIAYIGTHSHDQQKRNEAYMNTYMFMIEVPVSPGCCEITLPEDENIVIFSATALKE